jgi:Uma2 family endonuclease
MSTTVRFTSADLASLPDDGKRYEIIDGELIMSRQPHANHQDISVELSAEMRNWNKKTKAGKVYTTPGVIFADDDDVAPDIVWISRERLAIALQQDGHLHLAPELVVEILSPGSENARRDREVKLKLYSRRDVLEYWIVNWRARQIEIYRRERAQLRHAATLDETDILESAVLPGFSVSMKTLFEDIPASE